MSELAAQSHTYRRRVLIIMIGTMSMMLIDATVVSIALPTIQADLGGSQFEGNWVVNGYVLAVAVLVAAGGRLADIHGLANVFLAGVVVFVLGAAGSGFAESMAQLIGARVVQGVGAAAMVPAAMALVISAYPEDERGRAMGIYTGVSMGFLAVAPVIGGVITQLWTWRGVFWLNVPIGVAVVAVGLVSLHRTTPSARPRFDFAGLVTMSLGLTALIVALMQSSAWGWGSPLTLLLLVCGLGLLTWFMVIERRTEEPLLELSLFGDKRFSVDLGVLGAARFVLLGLTVLGAVWLQTVLGFGSLTAGLSLLAVTLPTVVAAPVAGGIYDRHGARLPVTAGTALIACGFAWSAAFLGRESFPWLLPGLIAIGAGMGPAMVPASTDSLNRAPSHLRAEASGASQAVRYVSATLGLAVMGSVSLLVQDSRPATESASRALTVGTSASLGLAAGIMALACVAAASWLEGRPARPPTDHVEPASHHLG